MPPRLKAAKRAIRAKCLDCSCYSQAETRLCEAVSCPLWPFRAGRHPYHALAQKEAGNPADFEAGESIQAEEEAAGATVVGAQELFKANGIPFKALFVASEFLNR